MDSPDQDLPLVGPFISAGGAAWSATVPAGFAAEPSDAIGRGSVSRLVVCEDGVAQFPVHAGLAEIMAEGGGANVHWNGGLFFSATDNSDPNTNGRTYTLRRLETAPHLAAMGSCHMNQMTDKAAQIGRADVVGHFALVHSADEILQMIRTVRREIDPPADLRPYMALGLPELQPDAFDDLDAVVLEICNATRIELRGWVLNRAEIAERIIHPAIAQDAALGKAARRWFDSGISQANEKARADNAAILLDALPADTDEARLKREIVRDLRGVVLDEAEIRARVDELHAALPAPTLLALHTLRYMPDGRPIRWPAGLHETLVAIAEERGWPSLDTAALVAELGPENSLTEDLEHYQPAFLDILARQIFERLDLPYDR